VEGDSAVLARSCQPPGFGVTTCHTLRVVTPRPIERMKHKKRPPLGDLEHELLAILWRHGEMTAFAVRQQIARDLKDATIRTVLRRLEEKGYVTHTVANGAFVYSAQENADTAAASAVHDIVQRYCGGSLERMLLGLADAGFVSADQLKSVAGKLKRKSR